MNRPLNTQPWLHSPRFDGAFILGPALIVTLAVVVFADYWRHLDDVPLWLWVALIIGVDVSHVYSTLYRTYFDHTEFQAHRALYTGVPCMAWITGVVMYSLDPALFWRVVAYLAVFHFVRQQYGFLMMYKRAEPTLGRWHHRVDQWVIYLATIYPLVYWHSHAREFNWFIAGDFVSVSATWPSRLIGVLYLVTLGAYVVKEGLLYHRHRYLNLPRNALVFGTALSWYAGIVHFNHDVAFTATNVIAHGVPYIALIWLYRRNAEYTKNYGSKASWSATFGLRRHQASRKNPRRIWGDTLRIFSRRFPCLGSKFTRPRGFTSVVLSKTDALAHQSRRWAQFATLVFLLSIATLAYIEETLWDGLIWREHFTVLPLAQGLPHLTETTWLNLIVPLLAVPQITHYVLDAFIWRLREPNTVWKSTLFWRDNHLSNGLTTPRPPRFNT